jgi:hypothetical protein
VPFTEINKEIEMVKNFQSPDLHARPQKLSVHPNFDTFTSMAYHLLALFSL